MENKFAKMINYKFTGIEEFGKPMEHMSNLGIIRQNVIFPSRVGPRLICDKGVTNCTTCVYILFMFQACFVLFYFCVIFCEKWEILDGDFGTIYKCAYMYVHNMYMYTCSAVLNINQWVNELWDDNSTYMYVHVVPTKVGYMFFFLWACTCMQTCTHLGTCLYL